MSQPTTAQARKEKIASLQEAAALIQDGCTLAFGGIHAHNGPMALIREIIRRKVRGLHLIANVSAGMPADILIGAGCVDTVTVSYIGLEHHGFAPRFREAAQSGRIKVIDGDEIYYVLGLKAGALGLPFVPYPPGHEARDNPKFESTYKRTTDPYTGKEIIVSPPIVPDVGIIHVPYCDPFGNVVHLGSVTSDDLVCKASKQTIVTCEEVIPVEKIQADPRRTTIPGHYVDHVVPVPYGAHPLSCHGVYVPDDEHIRMYRDSDIRQYLDRYVDGLPSHDDYLDHIGAAHLIHLRETL